jgi:hypothetical protein
MDRIHSILFFFSHKAIQDDENRINCVKQAESKPQKSLLFAFSLEK